MIEVKDIVINCDGYDFTDDLSVTERKIDLEDLLDMCNEFYLEKERLLKENEKLIDDMESNYKRIDPADQYGISDRDFI